MQHCFFTKWLYGIGAVCGPPALAITIGCGTGVVEELQPKTDPKRSSGIVENDDGSRSQPEPEYVEPLVPPIVVLPENGTDWKEQIGSPDIQAASDFSGFDFTSDLRAGFHAHGEEVCASGCAASRHPTPKLSPTDFRKLIREYAEQPIDAPGQALESLLFYGRQVTLLLDREGAAPLDERREAYLRSQLTRTHATIAFRLVDEQGVIRCEMPPTRVPLDRRHVFEMETKDLPPIETSGTVKRVGLHHLWTRL